MNVPQSTTVYHSFSYIFGMKHLFSVFSILAACSIVYAYSLQYHPLLLKTKDNKGITLAKTLDDMYREKISVKDGRCRFFEKRNGGSDLEYELDRCRIDYNQQTVYTQADRLNGIEIKGRIWVEGNSFRTREVGRNWTEWKSSEFLPGLKWYFHTGMEFAKKNGEFVFAPTKGLNNIRGEYKYMSKQRAEAIKNGDAAGIVIQESGSGQIVIQESR